MSSVVLIDAGSFNYYRATATMSWYRHQKEAPPMSLRNPEFLASLESQARSCLQKFQKVIKKTYGLQISLNEMYFIKDCPRETIWRHQYYAGYKANRDDREQKEQQKLVGLDGDDLQMAIDRQPGQYIKYLHQKLSPLFQTVQVDGAEADDVVAVLTKFFLETGVQRVIIVSLDSDFLQLLNDRVYIYSPKTWDCVRETRDPRAILKAKILAGDASDCIRKNTYPVGSLEYWQCYRENSRMIDFNYIPNDIQSQIVKKCVSDKITLPISWARTGTSTYYWPPIENLNAQDYFQNLVTFSHNIYHQGASTLIITQPPPIPETNLELYQEFLFETGRILLSFRLDFHFSPESPFTKTISILLGDTAGGHSLSPLTPSASGLARTQRGAQPVPPNPLGERTSEDTARGHSLCPPEPPRLVHRTARPEVGEIACSLSET